MAFTGQVVEIPLGYGGYNANLAMSQIALDELIQARNVTFQYGSLQKEGGSTLYTPSALSGAPVILGGHDWFPNLDSTQRSIIVGSDKKLRRDTGAGSYSTTLRTLTNTPNSTPVFVEGGREAGALPRHLFIYTGTNNVQTLEGDGVTTRDLLVPPVDWATTPPTGGCIHLNRHWAYGGANPHWIYGSDDSDHEDFGAPKTATGTLTDGSFTITNITVPSTWKINDSITDPQGYIPPGTLIQTFTSNSVTMTNAAIVPTQLMAANLNQTDQLSGNMQTGLVATPVEINTLTGTMTANTVTVTEVITATDLNTFAIPVYPGVGEKIIAIISFKGMLIVGKYPRGIYYVNMTDPNSANWFTVPLSLEIGMASPNAWGPVDDDILFMDAQGSIHMLSAVLAFADYGLRSISDLEWMRNYIVQNINYTYLPNVQCAFYLAKREAHFALTGIGSTTNNVRLVVDFNRSDKIRFRYSDKDALASVWLARDTTGVPRLTGGDALGHVWTLDQANISVNGVGYAAVFQTAHLDFGTFLFPTGEPSMGAMLGSKRKNFKFLELIGEPQGGCPISIDVYLDGNYSQTLSFDLGSTLVGLGTFKLDINSLGQGSVQAQRRRLVGSGKRISITGTATGVDQNFSLSSVIFSFVPSHESTDH